MSYDVFAVVAFTSIRTWDNLLVKERVKLSIHIQLQRGLWSMVTLYTYNIRRVSPPIHIAVWNHLHYRLNPKHWTPQRAALERDFDQSWISCIRASSESVIKKNRNDVPLCHNSLYSIKNILRALRFENCPTFLRSRSTIIFSWSGSLLPALLCWWSCSLAWACFRWNSWGCRLTSGWGLFGSRCTRPFHSRGLVRGSRVRWIGACFLDRWHVFKPHTWTLNSIILHVCHSHALRHSLFYHRWGTYYTY